MTIWFNRSFEPLWYEFMHVVAAAAAIFPLRSLSTSCHCSRIHFNRRSIFNHALFIGHRIQQVAGEGDTYSEGDLDVVHGTRIQRIKKKIINVNKITFNKHLPIYYSSTFSSKYNYLKAFNYPEAYCSSCFKFVCFSLAHVHGWVRERELARLRLHTFRWYFNTQTAILLSGSIVVRNKQKQRDLCTHKPMHKHTMGPVLIFFSFVFNSLTLFPPLLIVHVDRRRIHR